MTPWSTSKGSLQDSKTSHRKHLRTGLLPLGVSHGLETFLDSVLLGKGWAEAEVAGVGSTCWPLASLPFLELCVPSVCTPSSPRCRSSLARFLPGPLQMILGTPGCSQAPSWVVLSQNDQR